MRRLPQPTGGRSGDTAAAEGSGQVPPLWVLTRHNLPLALGVLLCTLGSAPEPTTRAPWDDKEGPTPQNVDTSPQGEQEACHTAHRPVQASLCHPGLWTGRDQRTTRVWRCQAPKASWVPPALGWDLLAWMPPIRMDPTLRRCGPGAATPVPPRYPLPEQPPESLPQAQGGQRGLARGGSWPVGSPCLTGGPCPGLRPPTNNPQRLCAGQQKSPESCCLQCPRPNLRTGPPPGSPSGCPPPTGQAQVEEAHPFCAEESHPVTVTKCPLRG